MSRRKRRPVTTVSPTTDVAAPKQGKPTGLTTDTFSNVMARLGFNTANLMEGTEYPLTRLTQQFNLMNSLYRNHWIIRKIIDTIPQDACRNWITITSQLDPEQIRKVEKLWRTRKLKAKVLEGLRWGRLYGGAGGVIMIEGHDDILDQPLELDMVMPGTFKGLQILDRWSGIYPDEEVISDINDADFGLPEYYQVTTDAGSWRVHHSRIIRFTGRQLPYWEKLAEVHWGESEVEVIFDELKKRDNTSFNISSLVFLANLRVMKMGDLGQLLAVQDQQGQSDLYNTLQAQNWLMSNMGIHVMDKEDAFETHQYSFAGLNDIYESFMLDIAGAAQIPVTKLFGRAPAGMNATGESDMENYYEVIQQEQESVIAPILDKLLPIMFVSELGAVPDDFDYTFNPIRTPSDKEIAELSEKKTQSILEVYNAGLFGRKIALKELKQLGESTGMYTNITDEDIEEADNDLSAGEIEGFGGMGVNPYGEEEQEPVGAYSPDRATIQNRHYAGDSRPGTFRGWLRKFRRHP
ncbi:hypothetical protein SAMN04487969_102514 [Paenibacillus algorifonticola]|uniref:Anti-CBASS protein Acb1-like N-terminal domain-containing protein n=1 Tax=Paenibacillus algorifonticola TaxID=684063 RepID=A0A1I2AJP9_9BACL|nr:DUF1073 domain-containing protein [Paenibacillus algorifonticola]SFE43778.1 hypothetical protein SAMN04487969_102514 [Paenibacillus algorifonticola]